MKPIGVRFWEEKIKLPTLSLGPFDPNPKFETYQTFRPYPYPYTYQHADKIKSVVEYLSLNLENEFLKLIVLPHLGSRIYSLYDKVAKKELIHRPERVNITFLRGTSGGTYVGLGMELSCPDHHSLTNSRKREYSVLTNPDQSKTIIVGELELRYGMRWAIHLTLKPGVAGLFHKVIIHNQANTHGRFRYWANGGIALDGRNLEVFFPEKEAWEHGGECQPISWPVYDGIDMRFPDNVPQTVGLESKDVRNGFFAYYDHLNKHGLVHYADPGEIKGKKYWTWGSSAHARHRAYLFSDGKKFMELQSGRDEDQEVFEILAPFSTVRWDEVWYPLQAIGKITNAAKTLAINILTDFRAPRKEISFKIQSILKYDRLQIEMHCGTEIIGKKEIAILPGELKEFTFPLIKKVGLEDSLSFQIRRDNVLVLEHKIEKEKQADKYIEIIADTSLPKIDRNPDYLMKLVRERLRRFPQPKFCACDDLLDEILQKDPGHAEALKLRGIFHYERGLFAESVKYLNKSLERNYSDGETHYFLGLNHYRGNALEDAYFSFCEAVKFNQKERAYFYLGIIAVKNNDLEKALVCFRNAVDHNAAHTRARIYYALCLHKLNAKKEALKQIAEAETRLPSDPLVLVAKALVANGRLDGFNKTREGRGVFIQLHRDMQTYYELVLNLIEINFYRDALELLKEAEKICKGEKGTGMIRYYEYFLHKKLNKTERAHVRMPLSALEYTFPFRLEEMEMLDEKLKDDPSDKFAWYYLGLIQAGLINYEQAYEHIKKAVELGLKHPVVYNCLGEIARKTLKNNDLAIKYFEKSLALDKNNVFTLDFLASAYSAKKEIRKLDALFKHPWSLKNLDLLGKFINHLMMKGDLDGAIEVLEKKVNFPNMVQALYPSYSEALIRRGILKLRKMKYAEAIKDFQSSLNYRANFGAKVWMKKYNIRAEYFLGLAHKKRGEAGKAEEIWRATLQKQEQYQDWTISGTWNYGFWVDRFYQGWILKELGRKADAVTYFDGIRAYAAHKFNSQLTSAQRKELLTLAYNGLKDEEIYSKEADIAYLSKE